TREGSLRPTVHAHASAFTEVVLHVDDDQRLMRIHLDNLSSNRVGITGSPRDICVAAGGSSAKEAACRSRAVDNGSRPTISPSRTNGRSRPRSSPLPSPLPVIGLPTPISSATAMPRRSRCRSAYLRPPWLPLSVLCFSTGTREPSCPSRATSLYT